MTRMALALTRTWLDWLETHLFFTLTRLLSPPAKHLWFSALLRILLPTTRLDSGYCTVYIYICVRHFERLLRAACPLLVVYSVYMYMRESSVYLQRVIAHVACGCPPLRSSGERLTPGPEGPLAFIGGLSRARDPSGRESARPSHVRASAAQSSALSLSLAMIPRSPLASLSPRPPPPSWEILTARRTSQDSKRMSFNPFHPDCKTAFC